MGDQYILLKILGGKAFIDFINNKKDKLVINISFLGNHFRTEPVRAECEPCFN